MGPMTAFLQFAAIGFGLGSAYGLFAQGAVLIYRGSGIVNFGHGAIGMLGAYAAFVSLDGKPFAIAIAGGLGASALTGLLFQVLVLRPLSGASPVTRLIATLGLLSVVQSGLERRFGTGNRSVDSFLPHDMFRWGSVRIQEQVLYIGAITAVTVAALWAATKYTRIGLAIRASAENERATQTLGWSSQRLSMLTWMAGSAIAGLAGILVAPLTGLSPGGFTLVVTLAALAAAVLGRFRSFPGTWLGGMVVGMGEAMVTLYREDIERLLHQRSIPGLNRIVPFVVILAVLVVGGRALPLRSHVLDRLPRLGTGVFHPRVFVVAVAVFSFALFVLFDEGWAIASFVSLTSGVVVLSIVVLTGFAGQLSLAQWTLAGVGAVVSSALVGNLGWPLELAMPAAALLTMPAGLLFALPALRTRGVNLAVVTLGLGYTIRSLVFSPGTSIGSALGGGRRISTIQVFGIDVDSIRYPHRWAGVCLVVFVLSGILVANLRRSRAGRQLVAVRTNERAAASLGVSVFGVKLYAFAVASALAGLGGVLVRFQYSDITYESFDTFRSIDAVGYAVIGGVGFVIGPFLSAIQAFGGIGTKVLEDVFGIGGWEEVIAGVVLLTVLVVDQNGLASWLTRFAVARTGASSRGPARVPDPTETPTVETPPPRTFVRVKPASLEVSGLSVTFGAVRAVHNVSFSVNPGEVVGLIGPNGAGKTTIIDAVTGFVSPSSGSVGVGGGPVDAWSPTKRARHGLRRTFQSLELFEDLTVQHNVLAGSEPMSRARWVTDLFWPSHGGEAVGASSAIAAFGLEHDAGRLPAQLSHGRRRFVSLARAVASEPSVLLLDEPAAGLDARESGQLSRIVRSLADDRGMGVLLVEHDVALVLGTCDRVIVIDFGVIIATGTPAEIRTDPVVRAAYLGSELSDAPS